MVVALLGSCQPPAWRLFSTRRMMSCPVPCPPPSTQPSPPTQPPTQPPKSTKPPPIPLSPARPPPGERWPRWMVKIAGDSKWWWQWWWCFFEYLRIYRKPNRFEQRRQTKLDDRTGEVDQAFSFLTLGLCTFGAQAIQMCILSIWDHFGPTWTILYLFRPFRTILDHLVRSWTISDYFLSILDLISWQFPDHALPIVSPYIPDSPFSPHLPVSPDRET